MPLIAANQQFLVTLLPGDPVIMGNLAAYKVAGIRQVIEAVGARLGYLPPYSPDLNPIELAFAKFKALLRSAGARVVDHLEQAINSCINQFTMSECRNYFRPCGYSVRY